MAAVKVRPQMGPQEVRRSLEERQGGLLTNAATPKRETCSSRRRWVRLFRRASQLEWKMRMEKSLAVLSAAWTTVEM